jgi:hypothetical protein
MKPRILYLVHDLCDSTVRKRVAMLQDGGAQVTLAGFRRKTSPLSSIGNCSTINLGQTYNRKFLHRLWSVIREGMFLKRYRSVFSQADIIIARNLEMLALAVRGNQMKHIPVALIYECLDIHRLLAGKGLTATCLRKLEGNLARQADALITSSPAFITRYFTPLSKVQLPATVVENKIYAPGNGFASRWPKRQPGPPWKIGWFGAIRCRKSLQLLARLVMQSHGLIEVVIRGEPALDQFDDFYREAAQTAGLQFLGPYDNATDLEAIYRGVHFTWAIDMFEERLNSSWLLPNRLYEGGMFGAVPIAQAATETGHFVNRLGIGITLTEPKHVFLREFFDSLTAHQYALLEEAMANVPASTWKFETEDCRKLVNYLSSLESSHSRTCK